MHYYAKYKDVWSAKGFWGVHSESSDASSGYVLISGKLNEKDGKTYMVVRTDYPNTVFNSGRGILVDNGDEYAFQARKRFGLGFGIQAGYGIGFRNGQPVLTPYIGLGASLNWNPRRLQF